MPDMHCMQPEIPDVAVQVDGGDFALVNQTFLAKVKAAREKSRGGGSRQQRASNTMEMADLSAASEY